MVVVLSVYLSVCYQGSCYMPCSCISNDIYYFYPSAVTENVFFFSFGIICLPWLDLTFFVDRNHNKCSGQAHKEVYQVITSEKQAVSQKPTVFPLAFFFFFAVYAQLAHACALTSIHVTTIAHAVPTQLSIYNCCIVSCSHKATNHKH